MEPITMFELNSSKKNQNSNTNKSFEKKKTEINYKFPYQKPKRSFSLLSHRTSSSNNSFDLSMKSDKNKEKTKKDDILSAKNYSEFSKLKKNHYKENICYSIQSVEGNNEEVKEDFKKFSEHFQKSFILFFYILKKLSKRYFVYVLSAFFFSLFDFFKVKFKNERNLLLVDNSNFFLEQNNIFAKK